MEAQRASAWQALGQDPWRYGMLAVLLASGLSRWGPAAGLGLVAFAFACVGGVALHAVRARLLVLPGELAHRRFFRWRRAELAPGARLVRVRSPGPRLWGAPEDHAMYVVADADDRRRLHWTGAWDLPPEEIADAAGIAFHDFQHMLDDAEGRALLPFPARHPVLVGVATTLVIIVVVLVSVRYALG